MDLAQERMENGTGKSPQAQGSADGGGVPHAALGAVVGSGMAWMVGITILNKLVTFVAQVVLGWRLTPEDYDAFNTAMAVAALVYVCREAGMREYLAQKRPEEHEREFGSAFWLALGYNLVLGLVVCGLALPLSRWLGSDQYAPMLWVLAGAFVLGTAGELLFNKLRVELRFGVYSRQLGWLNLVRQGSIIGFAMGGAGALSMAWGALVSSVTQWAMGWWATRDNVLARKPEPARWPGLLKQTRWLMLAALANTLMDWGPFAVLRPVLRIAREQAGLFAFGFNIIAQVGVLLGATVTVVLVPALSRFAHDRERMAGAVGRCLRTVMLVGSAVTLGLCAVMEPLENLLWHGRWSAAVPAIMVLGAFYVWRVTFGVTSAVLMAMGRFRAYAILTLVEGLGVTLATACAALVREDATSIALGAGLWLLVSRMAVLVWLMRGLGVGAQRTLGMCVPVWLLSVACAALAWYVERSLPTRELLVERWALVEASGTLSITIVSLVRCALAGGVFCLLFAGAVRLLQREALEDMASVAPVRVRPLLRRAMLLPARQEGGA